MSKNDEKNTPNADTPHRSAAFWSPKIEVHKTAEGVIYIDQLAPLPPYPRRVCGSLR